MKLRRFIPKTIREYLNENITLYHGSPNRFDKFTTSKMGTGSGKQIDGWGLYFTNSKESAKLYGEYVYEVTLSENSTFIDFNKPVKKDMVRNVLKAVYKHYNKNFDIDEFNSYYDYVKNKSLPKVDFNDYELIMFDYSGFLFYRTLSRALRGDKAASILLYNIGIDGLKRSISGTRTDYVIFDGSIINIKKLGT